MTKTVDAREAAGLLGDASSALILTHKNPDGDTVGSGFALCAALRKRGITAHVAGEKPFPKRYDFLCEPMGERPADFKPNLVVSVDTASKKLLGALGDGLDEVDLAIDHHASHEDYQKNLLLRQGSASCCEIVADVIDALGVSFDGYIADALFTGISTDTGCFRYPNTTPSTHRLAARLIECGARSGELNRLFFETKSRARLALELEAMRGIRFFENGAVSVVTITKGMLGETGCTGEDVEGITALSRCIEGVEAGVTLREIGDSLYKASVRTNARVDASAVCASFGGGGHVRAGGCELRGTAEEAASVLVARIREEL